MWDVRDKRKFMKKWEEFKRYSLKICNINNEQEVNKSENKNNK